MASSEALNRALAAALDAIEYPGCSAERADARLRELAAAAAAAPPNAELGGGGAAARRLQAGLAAAASPEQASRLLRAAELLCENQRDTPPGERCLQLAAAPGMGAALAALLARWPAEECTVQAAVVLGNCLLNLDTDGSGDGSAESAALAAGVLPAPHDVAGTLITLERAQALRVLALLMRLLRTRDAAAAEALRARCAAHEPAVAAAARLACLLGCFSSKPAASAPRPRRVDGCAGGAVMFFWILWTLGSLGCGGLWREWLAILAAIMTADPAAAVAAARTPCCVVELIGQLDSDDAAMRRDAASALGAAAAAEGRPQQLDILRQTEVLPGLAALLAREGAAAPCPGGCAACWGAAAAADALTAASGGAAAGELGRRLMAAPQSLFAIAHQLEAPGAPSLGTPTGGGGGGGGGNAGAGPDAGAPGRASQRNRVLGESLSLQIFGWAFLATTGQEAAAAAHLQALAAAGAISRGALTPRESSDATRHAALAAAPGLEAALRRCGCGGGRGRRRAACGGGTGSGAGAGGTGGADDGGGRRAERRRSHQHPSAAGGAPSGGGSGSGGAGPSGGGAPGVQQGPVAAAAHPPPSGCLHCGSAVGPGGARLKVCRGCRAVRFCSQDCYVRAWRGGHRAACAALRAAREWHCGHLLQVASDSLRLVKL
ncbi:MAG: hypothetical protein J3K34DRAFT_458659 [Monoraphidium minutum]|nr:MAG: hypothetical protein J3K34DRAFT_458659 [Monoraphidium minutum]